MSIILLFLLFISPASATGSSYHFSSNNSTALAEVWGKDITMAKFMEKVYPGSLKVLPKDSVERLKTKPMIWPNPKKIQPGKKQTEAKNNLKLNTLNGDVTIQDIIATSGIYQVSSESYQTPYSNQLGFASYSKVITPTRSTTIPEISVSSYLYKDSGTIPIATETSYGLVTNDELADGVVTLSSGTHSYYTVGQHTMVWPIGCTPAATSVPTLTPTMRITR